MSQPEKFALLGPDFFSMNGLCVVSADVQMLVRVLYQLMWLDLFDDTLQWLSTSTHPTERVVHLNYT